MTVPFVPPPSRWRRFGGLFAGHAAATVMLAGAYLWGADVYEGVLVTEHRAEATITASTHAGALTSGLNERLALVRGLTAFVTVNAGTEDLDSELAGFASALGRSLSGVRNISAAPEFIVRYVNPLKGNERVLGNDLLKDPRPGFAETVQRALITHDVTVHGPLPLLQGGQGLIARQVVFNPDRPWGAVGMVFDLQPILDTGRFDTLPNTLSYALRTAEGRLIAGDAAVLDHDPVTEPVLLPDGHWELTLAPRSGWTAQAHQGNSFPLFNAGFALVALLTELVVFLVLSRRKALESLVEQRTAELTRTQRELERFAYVAAHDLQEPLRAVSSYTQLLARNLNSRLDDDDRECVGHVLEGAQRLKMLLRDVQLFLAEDRIPLSTSPTPSDEALAGALATLKGRIEGADATVTTGTLPTVMADPRRLREILTVMIANAIEYRAPDRPLTIHVSGRQDGDYDVLSVADNGIGIEPQYHSQIFDVFRRLHGRDEHPGTGMGLAIARKMVDRLGGRISLTSQPGAGTTFFIHLPRRPSGDML